VNPESIHRVRASYALIAERVPGMIERFYALLFERLPAARRLFPTDMGRQRQHLLAALATVARNLHQASALEAPLRELGARHLAYGALPEHYPIVREALLDALAETAGQAWSTQLHADWRAALDQVAAAMLRGAYAPATEDAPRGP
jgi:hemoglobin-like flavoprotein